MNNIILKDSDINELNSIIAELPHKYAVVLITFFQKRVNTQEAVSSEG